MTQNTNSAATRPVLLADEITVQANTENPNSFYGIELVATDDNPSLVGTMKVNEAAAWQLLKDLAKTLGATVVTEGQKQDLGLLVRETIAAADDRKTEILETSRGIGLADLSRMTDDMRDLRDTFRRADIISG